MSRLTCIPDADRVLLAGTINEAAKLVDLIGHAKDKHLVLDLAGITFINSMGVREWIRLQQAAAAAGISIELQRVAEPIVHQLNIMPATRGVSKVTSFFAPYECEECDREHEMLLDVRAYEDDLARNRPPRLACPTCRRALVFLHPPELYFTFLTSK